jgi:hypothetical protein
MINIGRKFKIIELTKLGHEAWDARGLYTVFFGEQRS